jgi:serine phosphatase RsbU (regulator of sigma subunit)
LASVLTYDLLATVEFVTVFAKEASSVHERQEEENNQLQAELEAARSEFRDALKADRPEFSGEILRI